MICRKRKKINLHNFLRLYSKFDYFQIIEFRNITTIQISKKSYYIISYLKIMSLFATYIHI